MHSAATDLKSLRLLLLPPPSRHSLLRKDKLRKIAQKLIRLLHSSDLGVVFTLLHFNTLLYYTTLLQEFTTRIYYKNLLHYFTTLRGEAVSLFLPRGRKREGT
jgi:hypothetical protein